MTDLLFWGGALRFAQALVQAAPTILVGLLMAGVMRRLLGQSATRRLFGGNGPRSLVQAWAIGMLLPVCSLGALPMLREMRRAGVGGGAILAFALAAPLFNPLSLLYGLTLSQPLIVLAFAFGSLVVVTLVGALWQRLIPGAAAPHLERPAAPGLKRLASIVVVAAREACGPSLIYVLVGLFGVAALSAFLPLGSLQTSVNHDNPQAPLTMAVVAIPAYATPMTAMSQLGSMFQHGNSPGAAFVLLVLGAGTNLGTLAWSTRNVGIWRTFAWLAALIAVVLAIAYAIENPLYPADVEPAGHTHAFDVYCSPFHADARHPAAAAIAKLRESVLPHEAAGVALLLMLVAGGAGLKAVDRRWKIETWLESAPSQRQIASWHNRPVPGPVLGIVALAAIVAFSIVGCYAYYPAPNETLEEMRIVRVDALAAALQGDAKQTEHWISIYEDWTRKLEVGAFIRQGRLGDYRRMKSRLLRDKMELLEHAVSHGDKRETRKLIAAVDRAHRRLADAYRDDDDS